MALGRPPDFKKKNNVFEFLYCHASFYEFLKINSTDFFFWALNICQASCQALGIHPTMKTNKQTKNKKTLFVWSRHPRRGKLDNKQMQDTNSLGGDFGVNLNFMLTWA